MAGLTDLGEMLGASHAFEIPFVFGHWDLGREARILFSDGNLAGREELSAKMMSYWAQFAHTGDPGRGRDGGEVAWTPWQNGAGDNRLLLLDTRADGGIRMSPLLVNHAAIARQLAADERFSPEERCALGARLFPEAAPAAATFAGGC